VWDVGEKFLAGYRKTEVVKIPSTLSIVTCVLIQGPYLQDLRGIFFLTLFPDNLFSNIVYCFPTGWAKKNRTCLSVDNSAMVRGKKSCDKSKVSECCKELTTNLHSEAFKYFLPNLHKYLSPLIFCQI